MTQLLKLKVGDMAPFMPAARSISGDMEPCENSSWYCATVHPTCHLRVERELSRQGFRSFYPKTRRWVSHARTKKAVERPILGRYIFIEVDHPRQSFATVRDLHDIECLISSLGRPTKFPSHWVEGLLSRYLAGEWDEIAQGKVPVGARIRIVEGEFDKALATVVSAKGSRVDLKLLEKNQVVRMNQCSVRAA